MQGTGAGTRMLPGAAAPVLAATLASTAAAAEQTIDFEEPLPVPNDVGRQYCTGAVVNQGVEFLGTARVYVPQAGTRSPTHALTNEKLAGEFDELEILQIHFTTGQSFVKVKAGLDQGYPYTMTGTLRAYSGWPGQSPLVGQSEVFLNLGPNPITTELAYTSTAADIHGVEIEYTRSDGVPAIEVIDDLRFSAIGPTCVNDTVLPQVTITTPTDGQQLHHPTTLLGFRVNDGTTGSGIASVEVQYSPPGGGAGSSRSSRSAAWAGRRAASTRSPTPSSSTSSRSTFPRAPGSSRYWPATSAATWAAASWT